MPFDIGALAPLQGLQQGWMQGQDQVYKEALRRLALQQAQQEQQALGLIGKTLPLIGQQDPNAGIPQQRPIGLTPQSQPLPQVPNATSAMGAPSAVKGSWFGNAPGWNDPSDSGLQANGRPVGAGPGIALPSRATLGQQFDVTAPSGQTMTLPQTDVGPAAWTGRGVDINAPAAAAMGYTPQNFPTDRQFIIKAHRQLDVSLDGNATKLIQQGLPGPAVQDSTKTAMLAGREIDPVQWGRATRNDLIKAIDKADPSASDPVKALAFLQLNKILAPEEKIQAQMWAKENQQAIQVGLAGIRADTAEAGLQERERHDRAMEGIASGRAGDSDTKGWQIVQGPDGQPIRVKPGTGETAPINLPAGTTKLGAAKPSTGQAPLSEGQAKYWAKIIDQGGALPPGVSRNKDVITQIMAQTAGGEGDPGEFLAKHSTVTADSRSQSNMTKMADAATSFERTASQNFDLALKLSKDAVPTDWGPWLNAFVEKAETQAGNKDVPPYVAAMMTAANEYAKIMSGSTGSQGSTVDSRREAAELFSPYLSAGQIDRVVAIAKADMANRKQSLYGQIDDIKSRLRQSPATPSKTPTTELMGGSAQPQAYRSAVDVEKDFMAGKLSKEQAEKILIDQFGAK